MAGKGKVVYEDKDIVVSLAPRDEEIPDLVIQTIRDKGYPMFFDELVREFSGIVGEDRLRRAISHLLALKKLVEYPDGSLGLPGMNWQLRRVRKRRRKRTARIIPELLGPRTYYTVPRQ